MSRGSRDDPERERSDRDGTDSPAGPHRDAPDRPEPTRDLPARWSAERGLSLPRTPERQPVQVGRERYRLRESECHVLATVGAFRVVAERDLQPAAADLRALSDQGLIESRTIVMNHTPERVVVLTRAGHALLEAHRDPGSSEERNQQQYYAGLVKPRELAHDAQLYRLFETERAQLEDSGARVTRVVLDYELKRDYHAYVHRQRTADIDTADAREAFAREYDLPFANDRIELPDVRIEYETPDGLTACRDLELATEHYSRAQLSGKQNAGFRVYRAAGARGASATTKGGTPTDPHHLEWLR